MSDLYKIQRLMNLEPFVARVTGAMLQQASTMDLGGAGSPEKNLATFILKNPFAGEPSMVALAASDTAVLAQTTLTGDLAAIDNLTDDAIRSVVSQRWSLVASKYPA